MDENTFFGQVNAKLATSDTFKDHALVFVHGFNVEFDAALYRTAQIVYDLGFDGAPFLYSWPSDGSVASYESDQNASDQAVKYIKRFIEQVMARSNARHINFIAHSMGNKPLMRALESLEVTAEVPSDIRINQIILAAPDIDRDVFEDLAREIAPIGRGLTLYASANDRAMKASRGLCGRRAARRRRLRAGSRGDGGCRHHRCQRRQHRRAGAQPLDLCGKIGTTGRHPPADPARCAPTPPAHTRTGRKRAEPEDPTGSSR